jgi:hypothetical protein
VVRPKEVDHLEHEHPSVVTACVVEGDRQSNPPEGDILLARDHSVEWVRVTLELVPGKP